MSAPASTRFPTWDWRPRGPGTKVTPVTTTTDGAPTAITAVATSDGRVLCCWSEAGAVSGQQHLWMGYAPSPRALVAGDGSVPPSGRQRLASTSDAASSVGVRASLATGPSGVIYLIVAPHDHWSNITWYGLPSPGLSGNIGALLYSSSDDGANWSYVGRFSTTKAFSNPGIFGGWFAGGEIISTPAGDLLAVVQAYADYFGATVMGYAIETSSDGGATWTNRYSSLSIYNMGGSRNVGWLSGTHYIWAGESSISRTGDKWYSSTDGLTWTSFAAADAGKFTLWGVDAATLGQIKSTSGDWYSTTSAAPQWPTDWTAEGVVLPALPAVAYLTWLPRHVLCWSLDDYFVWWPGPGPYPWWPLYEWPEMIEKWPDWEHIGALAHEVDLDLERHLASIPSDADESLRNWRFPHPWPEIAPLISHDRQRAAALLDENMTSLEDLLERRGFGGGPAFARRWDPKARWPQVIERLTSDVPAVRRHAAGQLYEVYHQLVDLFGTRIWGMRW